MKMLACLFFAAMILLLGACGSKVADPAPGVDFHGTIDLGDKASSGMLSFKISADGASIEDFAISLADVKCEGLTAGKLSVSLGGTLTTVTEGQFSATLPAFGTGSGGGMLKSAGSMSSTTSGPGGTRSIEIENYNLEGSPSDWPAVADPEKAGQIDGQFSSPTQGSGKITIYLAAIGSEYACALGTFDWKAEAPG
jgi:hypothetical protein